jgi:ribonuclease HII
MTDYSFENNFNGPVCGIDEAGRGPLVGPVVAACVYIPPTAHDLSFWSKVTDSKKLTASKREVLFSEIKSHTVWGIGQASPEEIDALNIHKATLLAMSRAFDSMKDNKQMIAALIDGKFAPQLPCQAQAIVKGDSLSLSIAAASILAKVTRDGIMSQLHNEYSHYGWDRNSGYPTAEHRLALQKHGITPYHRKSYAPVKALLQAA